MFGMLGSTGSDRRLRKNLLGRGSLHIGAALLQQGLSGGCIEAQLTSNTDTKRCHTCNIRIRCGQSQPYRTPHGMADQDYWLYAPAFPRERDSRGKIADCCLSAIHNAGAPAKFMASEVEGQAPPPPGAQITGSRIERLFRTRESVSQNDRHSTWIDGVVHHTSQRSARCRERDARQVNR